MSRHGLERQERAGLRELMNISIHPLGIHSKLLTPEDLKLWTDSDVLTLAKQIRSRKQELDFELRKRGYFFQW